MPKGFLKMTNVKLNSAMTKTALLSLLVLNLGACGQKGALILPSDQAAENNKAIYLITPKKANGEPQATPQTDFVDQPSTDSNIRLREKSVQ